MKNHYPIGTVCEINNVLEPIMIIGYYSNNYEDGIVTYDYEGCVYPMGTTLNKKILFNEASILNVLFEGYSNELYNKLSNNFGMNFDEKISKDYEMTLIQSDQYDKLLFNNDGEILIADEKNIETNPNYNEEGNLVASDLEEDSESEYAFDEEGNLVSSNLEENLESEYAFDEEGNLVASNLEENLESEYAFDEEGNLVASDLEEDSESEYAFDEEGNLIN